MHAVQPSFWGEALPTYIRWASPYPPPKNTYGGGRTLPYPNLWPSADPLPWGSCGAIAHPQHWERRVATDTQPMARVQPIINNRHQRHLFWGRPNLNSFFSFIRPFRPNRYTTYGSRVIHIIYTGEPIPNLGGQDRRRLTSNVTPET